MSRRHCSKETELLLEETGLFLAVRREGQTIASASGAAMFCIWSSKLLSLAPFFAASLVSRTYICNPPALLTQGGLSEFFWGVVDSFWESEISSFSDYLVTKSVFMMLGKRGREIWPQFLFLCDFRRATAFLYLDRTYTVFPNRQLQRDGKQPSPSSIPRHGEHSLMSPGNLNVLMQNSQQTNTICPHLCFKSQQMLCRDSFLLKISE